MFRQDFSHVVPRVASSSSQGLRSSNRIKNNISTEPTGHRLCPSQVYRGEARPWASIALQARLERSERDPSHQEIARRAGSSCLGVAQSKYVVEALAVELLLLLLHVHPEEDTLFHECDVHVLDELGNGGGGSLGRAAECRRSSLVSMFVTSVCLSKAVADEAFGQEVAEPHVDVEFLHGLHELGATRGDHVVGRRWH